MVRTCAGECGGITLDCSHLGFGPPVKHKSGKEPSQESRVIVSRDCFRVPYTHTSRPAAPVPCALSLLVHSHFLWLSAAPVPCALSQVLVRCNTGSPSPASCRERENAQRRGCKRVTVRSVLSPPARRLRTRTRARSDREGPPREGERERAQTERGLLVNPSLALVRARGAGPLCPLSSGSFTLFVIVRGAGPMCPLTGFGPV